MSSEEESSMKRRVFFVIVLVALAFPTPGLFPDVMHLQAQGDEYVYTIVGGKEEPQTYEDQTVDGFSFINFTYRSLYPDGLEFRVTITPPEEVTYDQVILFYTFSTGKRGRIAAQQGDNPNEWVAVPYQGRGLPPWHEVNAFWGVRGPNDLSLESNPVHAVYYDASREWFRTENEDVLVYWYGMPEELGRYVLEAMGGNREKYHQGFGEPLPYRPMAVIFPPGPDWTEYRGDSSIDDTDFGFTGTIISEAGSTIQRVRTLVPAAIRKDCIWNPVNPDVEYQMQMAASTVVHEVAHLYQQEVGVSGPTWWVEGQATFFETFEEYPVHERLSTLAGLMNDPFPTFQGEGPGGGALSAAEDGCTHLIYDMGSSFMKWLADTHGGLVTYRTIVQEMASGALLSEALETATGLTLLDLENEWRTFLGIPPIAPEQLDPGLALDPLVEPYFELGEQITVPATTFQQPLYGRPTRSSAASGACFANMTLTIVRGGNDGTVNWYEVDCMGIEGWISQAELPQQ
jgi:hypothetical protein